MTKNKKPIDNRMGWILFVEDYGKTTDKNTYFTEYEICSEVRIPGVIEYGNGALLCGLLEEKNKIGLYTYAVQVKHVEKEYKFDKDNYSKEGYYFKDGLIGELLVLFSVFFQARFYLRATIIGDLTPKSIKMRDQNDFHYRKPYQFLNYEMFSDQKRNWAHENGLKKFLDTLRTIDGQYHQNLIRAFYWYAEAIKEIGADHQLFFIKMVSSIEALLKYVAITQDDLSEKISTVTNNDNFSQEQKSEIKNWLQNRKIKHRFSIFLSQYSKWFFKGGKLKAKHCYIHKKNLDDYAKRIYDARSVYLHTGKPMYLSMDMRDKFLKCWDVDPSMGMMADRKEFAANEKLPRTRWFERIANHCLKRFIAEIAQAK